MKKYLDGDSGALKRSIKFDTSDHTPITSSSTLNPGANDSSDNRNNIVFVELDLYTKSLQKNIYTYTFLKLLMSFTSEKTKNS